MNDADTLYDAPVAPASVPADDACDSDSLVQELTETLVLPVPRVVDLPADGPLLPPEAEQALATAWQRVLDANAATQAAKAVYSELLVAYSPLQPGDETHVPNHSTRPQHQRRVHILGRGLKLPPGSALRVSHLRPFPDGTVHALVQYRKLDATWSKALVPLAMALHAAVPPI